MVSSQGTLSGNTQLTAMEKGHFEWVVIVWWMWSYGKKLQLFSLLLC
jgi:hypothetical protein